MFRWAYCGLVLLGSTVAFAQTKDVIRESILVAPLVPNPFGGLPVAARQPAQPKPPPLPDEQPTPRRPRPIFTVTGPPKLDRNGDPLPAGAIARFGSIRLRHGVEVQAMTFTHDAKFLCTVSATEESVKVWDAATGKEVARLNTSARLLGLAKDSSVVVVDNNRIRVWMPATSTVRSLPEKTLPEDASPTALAVNPDGRSLAVATIDKILVIDLQTGKTLHDLKLPATPAGGAGPAPAPANLPNTIPPAKLLYSPDGRWLAGSGQNTGVWLWDLHTGKRIRTYRTETDSPEYAFSPDVTKIAITGQRLHLYTLDSEEEVEGFLAPPDAAMFAPRFSANGKTIFVVQEGGTVTPIDAATGETKQDFAPPDTELRAPFALTSDGAMAAAIDRSGGIRIWNPNTGKGPEVTRLPPLRSPGITSGGKSASVLDETHKLHTFDLATGVPAKAIQLQGDEDELAVPNAAFHRAAVIVPSGDDLVVSFVDTNTGKEISKYTLPPNTDGPGISFALANRDRVALFTQTGVIVVNPTTGKMVRTFTLNLNNNNGAISPDGRLVVTTAPTLTVWEVATGKKRLAVETPPSTEIMVFSADSRFLAFWDQNGTVVVADVRTGTVARRIQNGEGDDAVTSLALSSDGKRLGVGSAIGSVTVYDLTTGEILAPFGGHAGPVTGLVFTADGKRLISTSQDGTALVWSVPEHAIPLGPATNPVITSDEAYQLLGSTDPAQAQRGLDYFYRHPAEAVKQASTRMPAPTATPASKLAQLVADLANDDFPTREAAVKALEKIGGEAGALLKEVMGKSESAEARKLAGELLGKIEAPASRPDDLRILRVVEAMEHLRTPEARQLLEKWATGPAGHRLTVEATAALERLKSMEGK